MNKTTSITEKIELFGLTVLELREIEAKVGKDAFEPRKSAASASHHEPGVVAAILYLTPVVVKAIIALALVPRSGSKREWHIMKEDKDGVRTEVVLKESDYKTGTLSPAALKAIADFFGMDTADIVEKMSGSKNESSNDK